MHRSSLKSLLLALALAACGGPMEPVAPPTTTAPDAGPPGVDAGMPLQMTTCGPANLCSRTINECRTNLTQTSCEGWYARTSNCRDMAAYTACNCDCIKEATCSDYFACGNLCFNDHCK